ncbi:hypothetical protein BACCELL_00978 [Bacteroides cellulosilyticus DSM 14838]|uniref:Uncharacterized protein n=1 Tax=Bacteroides cellulosilyticus DSM 14838 TaxID=537012 RepID=E2N9N2_9BACE|nr:hypothetical protein BACCELL_00978 [Bacteroides cellulosilyticus DSM 14838]
MFSSSRIIYRTQKGLYNSIHLQTRSQITYNKKNEDTLPNILILFF